ncbi:hypothetical protein ACFCX4_07690 [Kitasatospora sp. NPDC056327]|uniref:hypothetical protein n=1 Tax=Kitasatospora sp. NPDC056327 TaxID=3345785 RepID=UPI0035D686DC
MSGQYPGQFGPPPGGAPAGGIPGAVPQPYATTTAVPPPVPGRQAGPYGVLGRTLVVLAPLLTVGLLGMVPSLLLAVRRRRGYDILGAALFGALFLAYIICVGIAGSYGKGEAPTADAVGTTAMVLMWLTTPVHFLLMDRRAVWASGRAARTPAAPAASYAPTAGYGYPAPAAPVQPYPQARPYPPAPSYGTPAPYPQPYGAGQPYGTAQPYPAADPHPSAVSHPPVRAAGPGAGPGPRPGNGTGGSGVGAAGPATSDELRELGELLRRQAREDRP